MAAEKSEGLDRLRVRDPYVGRPAHAEDLASFVLPMSWYWIIRGRTDEMSRWLRRLGAARDALPGDVVVADRKSVV